MTVFDKNVTTLETYYPELLPFVTADVSTEHIEVLHAKSGAVRLIVTTDDGRTVAVHNADDPVTVADETAEKVDVAQEGVVVLLGMGVGYLANALIAKLEEGVRLIVYEASPAIFKTALQHVDLTELLSSKRVKVLVGEDAELDLWCYRFKVLTGGAVRAVKYEPAFRLAPSIYNSKLKKELQDYTRNSDMNFSTVQQFGSMFTNNLLESIPHVLLADGVNAVKGVFSGKPAILVGAGPSLGKNVHLLQQAKGKAVIISADTMVGYLLERGIDPDFVVSVDPQERTYEKYKGVDIPSDVALVFHPGCSDHIFKHFPGPKLVAAPSMLPYKWLQDYWSEKGSIEGDVQCQVHLGFNLAEWMGCDPITIIGMDLCYTDDLMHVKGGSYTTPDEEAAYVQRGVRTVNMFGEQVRTFPSYLLYKTTFEKRIGEISGRCFNATEGGMNIDGAAIRRLADVIADFNDEALVDVPQMLRSVYAKQKVTHWSDLIEEVSARECEFIRLTRICTLVCRLLDRIVEHQTNNPGVADAMLVRLTHRAERLTSMAPSCWKALDLLQMVDFQLERYMLKETTHSVDFIEDSDEKLTKQIERGQRYYGDLLRVIPMIQPGMTRLRIRLEKMRDLDAAEKQGPAHYLDMAEEYAAIDLFDRAQEALDAYDDFEESDTRLDARHVEMSIRSAIQLNQLRRAFDRAEEARQAFPDHSAIQLLFQEASAALAAWEERVGVVRASLPESNNVSEFSMQTGDFYFRVGEFAMAAQHYRAAAAESNSGEAYYRLAKVSRELGQDDKAVSALEHALLQAPADPRIYYDLGVLAIDQARLDVAEQFFWKGVEVSLDDPEFCEASAAILCAVDAHQQAIPFYERALERAPGDPDLLRKIAQAYESVFEPTLSV